MIYILLWCFLGSLSLNLMFWYDYTKTYPNIHFWHCLKAFITAMVFGPFSMVVQHYIRKWTDK